MSSVGVLDDLTSDVLAYLKSREDCLKKYEYRSPQLLQRLELVLWISTECDRMNLSLHTVHLAVKYLDFFMDGHKIVHSQLHFVAVCCIILAAKIVEVDEEVPRLPMAGLYLATAYSKSAFVGVEMMICSYFDWQLNLPTATTFCKILQPFGLDPTDLCCEKTIVDYKMAQDQFESFVDRFLELSLQVSEFAAEKSFVVACSVIFCSRRVLKLTPSWPLVLQEITGFRPFTMFFNSNALLWAAYEVSVSSEDPERFTPSPKKRKLSFSPDSGYLSVQSP